MQETGGEANRLSVRPPAAERARVLFEEVYLRYAPTLRRVAVGRFRIAPEDAEGLVQDVFATFFMQASQVENVERYLIGGICNASRKHLQKNSKADIPFWDDDLCGATTGDVLRQIERKQLLSIVFARIGPRCRELLRRFYVRGESTATIGDALDATPNAIQVSLHRCRKNAVDAYRQITEKS